MPDLPRLVSDRYEIEEPLGRGGMGTVYRARDRVLDRRVAVKLLPAEMASDDQAADRLQREARSAARLNHPRIVSVFDAGLADGTPYLVMEYVEGRTLAEELADHGRLAPEQAASIAAGIAEALTAAHAAGVIHRDVKPANVLLLDGDEVKVADFGIAKAAEEDTITNPSAVVGSAPYLSPEQARGGSADARSDLYGLGVVLYEMLVGRPPFEADSPVAMAFKHLEEEPEPPSSVESGIPPELDRVVMTALAKDPADRYGSAGAFLVALQGFAEGPDTAPLAAVAPSADQVDTFAAAPAPSGRSRWLVRAVVVLVGLVAAVAALTLWTTTRSPGRAPGGEENPLPSVSPASLPGAGTSTPASPGVSPSSDPEDERESGGGDASGGGTSGSSDPPDTEPTEPASPSPDGSPSPPETTSEPPPSPSPSTPGSP
jgi:eukaryotic-like serine/threonine-protein kinase